jgi:hypothetical protein
VKRHFHLRLTLGGNKKTRLRAGCIVKDMQKPTI